MRARLKIREWIIIGFLTVLLSVLVFTSYSTKDYLDPSIQKFLQEKKNHEDGKF
jgi:hypothetical protein